MAYRYLAVLCVVALALAVISLVGRHLATAPHESGLAPTEETKLESVWTVDFIRRGDWGGLRAAAGTAYKRHPGSPLPPYFLAIAEFEAGNHEGALSYAIEARDRARANERHRGDPRYDRAVSRLREGHARPFPDVLAGE